MTAVTLISGPPSAEITLQPGNESPATIVNAPAVTVELTRQLGDGPPGPAGPSGTGAGYVHDQNTASTTWVIVHNLNVHPSVTVTDQSGEVILTTIRYLSLNIVEATFAYPTAGQAYLN